ncbi:MAG TPA: YaiO family outer membrane beta-barrel protein [Bacteroidia bacterium]|nr:YaiO family outer membrane beta-barrel protein [Bacteroidia bacterium]
MTGMKYYLVYTLFLSLLLSGPVRLSAQSRGGTDTLVVVTDTTDIDALFKKAREYSFQGNNGQARRICQKILEKKPNYYDVRTFLGRTYAWDKRYEEARTEFSRVLIEKEDDIEALGALIDVEMWTENYKVASDYLKIALGYYPTSEDLMLRKARLQMRLEQQESASLTLRRILDLNPGNKEALKLLNGMTDARLNNKFQLSFNTDFFDNDRAPQKLASGEIGRSFSFGSIAYRATYAERFSTKGLQSELDGYLRFVKSNYFYLNLGFSDSKIFPELRAGAEIFQKIPAGFELSGGFRYLQFSNPGTKIYTASLGNYWRNYWFSMRVYLTPKSTIESNDFLKKSSQTIILNIRNYFGDADNYFGIRLGQGQSPDERKITEAGIQRLKSLQGGIEYQRLAFGRWVIKGDIGYSKEEIRTDTYQQRISVGVQLKTIF